MNVTINKNEPIVKAIIGSSWPEQWKEPRQTLPLTGMLDQWFNEACRAPRSTLKGQLQLDPQEPDLVLILGQRYPKQQVIDAIAFTRATHFTIHPAKQKAGDALVLLTEAGIPCGAIAGIRFKQMSLDDLL